VSHLRLEPGQHGGHLLQLQDHTAHLHRHWTAHHQAANDLVSTMRFSLFPRRNGEVSSRISLSLLKKTNYFSLPIFSILSENGECPMCGENVAPEQLLDVEDIRPYILAAS